MERSRRSSEHPRAALSAIADAALYPRPIWRSERAYVLAAIAGVVGLGNMWRFPYMAGRHGGGTFLVAYAACVATIAVPLASLESAGGNLARRSPVGLFRRAAGRLGTAVGWAVVGITVVILSYYFVVTGWTLGYALDAFRGRLLPFGLFIEGFASLWLFLLVGIGVYALLLREMAAIERASLLLLPVLVVIVVALTVYGQSLDGASEARAFSFGVSSSRLLDTATWRAAAGQAFYSLGVGQGILIAYGSFVPSGTKILRSTSIIALTNSLISVVSAVMVFTVVFTFGIAPDVGSELSFTAFPRIFPELPGGAILAMAFFLLLFVAGFTSCLASSVVVLSAVRDELGLDRQRAARLTVGIIVALGVPSALSFTDAGLTLGGRPVLDRVDQATGSGVIVILGLLGAALLARRLPRRTLVAAFHSDPVSIGPFSLGPETVVRWAVALPVLAGIAYAVGTFV